MKNYFLSLITIMLPILVISCYTIPKSKDVPMELTAEEITMLAQKEIDSSNYKGAKAYYQIMLDRYVTDNAVVTAGEFEIAHILIKQKKYKKAEVLLRRVLDRFNSAGGTILPQKYRKLAENDLKSIQPKLKSSKKNNDDEDSISIQSIN